MQVNEEIPVIENDGFVLTSDKRSKDFLLTFAYSEKTAYFCFHHALTDAHGAVRFVKSFIAEYLRRSTGEDLFVPEELNPATPPKNEEYENPYSYITHQEHPFNLKSTKGFSVPEEDIENTSRHLRVSIPTDCILKISKNAESTFVSVIVMLLSNAISRAYPAHEKPIKIYCPVDMRSMLGCPETLQHCCYVEGTHSSPVGYLEGIFIKAEYRNHGFAKELLKECEKWAKEKGCTEFASDCELDNDDSFRFHRAMEFEEANRIICFKKDI